MARANKTGDGTLDQLYKAIRRCDICRQHLPLGPNPILRVSSTATILIAGQAPGIRVHESSIPFNDPSGDRLRQWMGVDKETFYDSDRIAIVPMGFCYPGSAERGDLPPRPECAKTWHPELLPLLGNIQLTLVIGAYAQKYYLGKQRKKSLTETVANWQQYQPNIIPLPHPSPRNNIWLKRNPWFDRTLLPTLAERVGRSLALSQRL